MKQSTSASSSAQATTDAVEPTGFDVEACIAELSGTGSVDIEEGLQAVKGLFFESRVELVSEQLALFASNREAAIARKDAKEQQRALISTNRERAIERKQA